MASEVEFRQAIAQRQLVAFDFGTDQRVVEPHVLGLKGGAEHLLGYQVGGTTSRGSSIGWRVFALAELANVRLLDQSFLGPRNWGSRHTAFDTILAVVR
jgi:hypothetical protein